MAVFHGIFAILSNVGIVEGWVCWREIQFWYKLCEFAQRVTYCQESRVKISEAEYLQGTVTGH